MTRKEQISGKKISQLLEEGILKKVEPFTKEHEEFQKMVRMTDGYQKLINVFTNTSLKGSDKQVAWAEKIREKKADQSAYEIISMMVSNYYGFDYDIDELIANKEKQFKSTNAAWWIENRF
jgi:hypothetical protein